MQNRRSFFGAIVGGIAACCGISRQAAAREAKQMPVARLSACRQQEFRVDDTAYIFERNGKYCFADVQFNYAITPGLYSVTFRINEKNLSVGGVNKALAAIAGSRICGQVDSVRQFLNERFESELFINLTGFQCDPQCAPKNIPVIQPAKEPSK